MKRIKNYKQFFIKESLVSIEDCKNIVDELTHENTDCEINMGRNDGKNFNFSIEYCPIEPEMGSYTTKTDIDVKASTNEDGTVDYKINLVSGQYGCDEEDEDSGFEPEFDWSVEATNDTISGQNETLEQLKDKLTSLIEEYCK